MEDDFNEAEMFQPAMMDAFAPPKNPLAKYFRVPGLNVKLPSGGAYMPPGAIQLTATEEIPVFPMRAADELMLKSPDALMSGYAIEEIITSCIPAIRAPRLISMPDLDVILLAVRAATYGEKMEVETQCPSCGEEHKFDCHLPSVLTTMKEMPKEAPVRLSPEVVAYLRPYNLGNGTKVALTAFNETRKLQFAEDQSEEYRTKAINESYKKITALNVEMMADCVMHIVTPEGTVNHPMMIREFLANIPRQWSKKIEKKLKELNDYGIDKRLDVTCSACQHEWKTELEFDPASFFANGS